jgi:hypothetical protein
MRKIPTFLLKQTIMSSTQNVPVTPDVFVSDSPPTTPRSCHIVVEIPNAPKKSVADRIGLAMSESYGADEFMRACSKLEPAEAVIDTGKGDIDDTASSAPSKKNAIVRAGGSIKKWIVARFSLSYSSCPCYLPPPQRAFPVGFPEP